jgi:hypothetical protein
MFDLLIRHVKAIFADHFSQELHNRSLQCEPPASATADRSATSTTSASGKFRDYFRARIFDSSKS